VCFLWWLHAVAACVCFLWWLHAVAACGGCTRWLPVVAGAQWGTAPAPLPYSVCSLSVRRAGHVPVECQAAPRRLFFGGVTEFVSRVCTVVGGASRDQAAAAWKLNQRAERLAREEAAARAAEAVAAEHTLLQLNMARVAEERKAGLEAMQRLEADRVCTESALARKVVDDAARVALLARERYCCRAAALLPHHCHRATFPLRPRGLPAVAPCVLCNPAAVVCAPCGRGCSAEAAAVAKAEERAAAVAGTIRLEEKMLAAKEAVIAAEVERRARAVSACVCLCSSCTPSSRRVWHLGGAHSAATRLGRPGPLVFVVPPQEERALVEAQVAALAEQAARAEEAREAAARVRAAFDERAAEEARVRADALVSA
jgi:hypothetical protein